MSFCTLARQITRRPVTSIVLAVCVALLSWQYYSLADSTPTKSRSRNMHIESIPMWEGSGNNYAYLVTDEKTKDAVIIDPANPSE